MGDLGSLAAVAQLSSGISSAAGGYANYSSSIAQGRYGRSLGNQNAQMALLQGKEAVSAGNVEASRMLERGAQASSSERARLAAQGVNVNTGSAAQVQQDITKAAQTDAETIRHNAALQSWGFGIDAINSRTHGDMGYIAGRNQGTQSLISGGLGFARDAEMAAYYGWGGDKLKKG